MIGVNVARRRRFTKGNVLADTIAAVESREMTDMEKHFIGYFDSKGLNK